MQPVPMQQDPNRQAYGGYGGYQQMGYQAFYGQYPQYGQFPQGGFGRGRGRGGFPGNGYGRGGYPGQGYPPMGMQYPGYSGRGGMMFAMRARRKKPFVGGSLETQRQWEQQTLCCFHLQGNCKFSEGCRFSHDDDGVRPCQFGAQCRVGHSSRVEGSTQPAAPTGAPQPSADATASN